MINLEEQLSWVGLIYLSWNCVLFAQSSFWNQCFLSTDSTWEALIWSLNVWKAFPINTNKGLLDCLNKYSDIFYHTELQALNDAFIFDSTLFKYDYSLYLIV